MIQISVENEVGNDLLTEFTVDQNIDHLACSDPDLILRATEQGLTLLRCSSGQGFSAQSKKKQSKPLIYFIDVVQFVTRQKTFPAAKQGAFNQALGKSKHIIDATAGWGGDALLMCAQGYQVSMIERNPVMALLLKDAMLRLAKTAWVEDHQVIVPEVIEANAIDVLTDGGQVADCVYLDPMFPSKRKKSAASNKNMQLLQWMVDVDHDADGLLQAAIGGDYRRVVVKRPDYALPLLSKQISSEQIGSEQINNEDIKPSTRFSSKLVHYDVYLQS